MLEWKTTTSVVAIDASGFTPNASSTYYSIRTEKTRHDYLKTTEFLIHVPSETRGLAGSPRYGPALSRSSHAV